MSTTINNQQKQPCHNNNDDATLMTMEGTARQQASNTGTVAQGKGSDSGVAVFAWQWTMASAENKNHSISNNQPAANSNSNNCYWAVRYQQQLCNRWLSCWVDGWIVKNCEQQSAIGDSKQASKQANSTGIVARGKGSDGRSVAFLPGSKWQHQQEIKVIKKQQSNSGEKNSNTCHCTVRYQH